MIPKEYQSTVITILMVILATAARIVTDKVTKISEIIGKLIVSAFVAVIVHNLAVNYNVTENIRVPLIGVCSYLGSDLASWLKHTWDDYNGSLSKFLFTLLKKSTDIELEPKKAEKKDLDQNINTEDSGE